VITGGASNGQGFETVIAQIAAETIGVDYAKVRVVHGQTDRIDSGLGAHASRATVMTGSATQAAALKLRAKTLELAGELMQAAPHELDIVDGVVVRRDGGGGGASMPIGDVAAALEQGSRHPCEGLAAEGSFHTAHQVYPYGSHLAVVAVDRDTGAVAVERYVIGYDVGRAINPMLVEGQIAGGFVQGLGGALMEEFRYSGEGAPLAVTFADYLMPTAVEAPALEIILTQDFPADLNPLGIKGAGESGITAVGAAIANAVEDAIGMPGAIAELPITPHRLREILENKRRPD
jgi:aerobic carbon-monoxide dehydrogenase large subunit